ncbi:MAG: xanthine phosphoribosyltransferase [Oscillospiraceae bacterium]|nr:xanthine phosphoribosyltransferase [Oscillospiraceae bacterium]
MKMLEDKILQCGTVLPGNVLKVDSFLNHQLDVKLINELGKELYNNFLNDNITKILTVEASGIAIACAAAANFDVPVVFAKKGHHENVGNDVYTAEVFSFTKKKSYTVAVSKKFLSADDNVLIVDDFLATGEACFGLKKIVEEAGAKLAGVGIAVEKRFQGGGNTLRKEGVKLKSLAIIDSMTDDSIRFGVDD